MVKLAQVATSEEECRLQLFFANKNEMITRALSIRYDIKLVEGFRGVQMSEKAVEIYLKKDTLRGIPSAS